MHWNTKNVIDQLIANPLPGNPTARVSADTGGDYDLPAINFEIDGINDAVRVTPYKDPNSTDYSSAMDAKLDDVEIYAVEVLTFQGDSRGGLGEDADEQIAILYGAVKSRLNKLGWRTIRHYDEIF